MRNTKLTPHEIEYGPAVAYRPDSILQGHMIGQLRLSSSEDRQRHAFDHLNWANVRPVGVVFLREVMSRMEDMIQGADLSRRIAVLFQPSYEAWCAIRDAINPAGLPMSEVQIKRLGLDHMRGQFSDMMSGPHDDIQRLNKGQAPSILAVHEPNGGGTVDFYAFHRLAIPAALAGASPVDPDLLRFAENLTMLVYPPLLAPVE